LFLEAIAVSNSGLEVYDRADNIVWDIQGADFREVDIASTSNSETIIAATGIFATHMNMPPQVRVYPAQGNRLLLGSAFCEVCEINDLRKGISRGARSWSRGEYHLEVYNELGALVFDKLVDVEKMSIKDAGVFDFDGDQREELVVPLYVFKLNGELVTNKYQEPAKR